LTAAWFSCAERAAFGASGQAAAAFGASGYGASRFGCAGKFG